MTAAGPRTPTEWVATVGDWDEWQCHLAEAAVRAAELPLPEESPEDTAWRVETALLPHADADLAWAVLEARHGRAGAWAGWLVGDAIRSTDPSHRDRWRAATTEHAAYMAEIAAAIDLSEPDALSKTLPDVTLDGPSAQALRIIRALDRCLRTIPPHRTELRAVVQWWRDDCRLAVSQATWDQPWHVRLRTRVRSWLP